MICETQVCYCNRPDKTLRMQRRKKEDRCWCRQGQGRIRLLTRIRWAFWDKSYGRATRETNHNSCCVKSGDRRVDVARFARCCCLWKRSTAIVDTLRRWMECGVKPAQLEGSRISHGERDCCPPKSKVRERLVIRQALEKWGMIEIRHGNQIVTTLWV